MSGTVIVCSRPAWTFWMILIPAVFGIIRGIEKGIHDEAQSQASAYIIYKIKHQHGHA